MSAQSEIAESTLVVRNAAGLSVGQFRLQLLPRRRRSHIPLLLDLSTDGTRDLTVPPVQVLEDSEYRFEFRIPGSRSLTTNRPEVLYPDTDAGNTGRLRTYSYTGTLPVTVFDESRVVGTFALEVRSRKLDYLTEYRWMLRDIAEQSAELIMDRFGVAEQAFMPADRGTVATLYQRVAFLRSLIHDERFQASLAHILRYPHVQWAVIEEPVRAGFRLRLDSRTLQSLQRPGPRVPWPNGPLDTLPAYPIQARTETSRDTPPNQFVKHALHTWRSLLSRIADLLRTEEPTFVQQRGLSEITDLLEWLEEVLNHDLFEETGSLARFPSDNQVLLHREGYRDIFRSFLLFEAAARLTWSGGEDSFVAGQRDVASLYEYWVFFQLANLISQELGEPFRLADLLETTGNGIGLKLKRGREVVVSGYTSRLGRKLRIDLSFNRSFSFGDGVEDSWTATMQPDFTLSIRDSNEASSSFEPFLLHFDAKYRLNYLAEVFGGERSHDPESLPSLPTSEVTRPDLLKMHSYRDAIRRSVGSFVLYPGSQPKILREYHELLPGLGAFVLRPSAAGKAEGSEALADFVRGVLDHAALQISQHERARYWNKRVFQSAPARTVVDAAPFLQSPPADVLVLLGYVKSARHWNWILRTQLYNLRADRGRRGAVGIGARELGCDLILLSCPATNMTALAHVTADPRVLTRDQLLALEYPNPQGLAYFCYELEPLRDDDWARRFTVEHVELVRRERCGFPGAPVAVSWLELVTGAPRRR